MTEALRKLKKVVKIVIVRVMFKLITGCNSSIINPMLKNNKAVVPCSTPPRANNPPPLVFRTRLTRTPSKKKQSIEPHLRYTIEECIHRLQMLITNNVPLPKSYAYQIKNYLLVQNLSNYEEEYCNKRQKTEEALSPLQQNSYIKSIVTTELGSPSCLKDEPPIAKSLKKRSLASRKASCIDQQNNETIFNLESSIDKLKQELASKECSLSDLKNQYQSLKQKEQQSQDQLTKALIDKIEIQENLTQALRDKEQEKTDMMTSLQIVSEQLRERETEIFYLWQTQLTHCKL